MPFLSQLFSHLPVYLEGLYFAGESNLILKSY